jgi:hypothetical protein
MNRADVGMIQSRSSLSFTAESFECLRVAGQVFWKELQRDEAVESRVLGFIDHAHPAATEFFQDAVVRDGLANHREGRRNLRFHSQLSQRKGRYQARAVASEARPDHCSKFVVVPCSERFKTKTNGSTLPDCKWLSDIA